MILWCHLLKSKGITVLDKLILTHGDQDHLGSAQTIIEQIKVKEVIVGDTINKKEIEQTLLATVKEKNIPVIAASDGMYWKAGKSMFQIIAPEKHEVASNDASVVIYADNWWKTVVVYRRS